MTGLPPSASVAHEGDGAKLFAPAAQRNIQAITQLLSPLIATEDRILEIASGTGQHIVALAAAHPEAQWFPTEIDAGRITSIDAYASEAGLPNLHPARHLDATTPDWGAQHGRFDLIYLCNLFHLLPDPAARRIIGETATALRARGKFVVYGPFKRTGQLTSEGDARFDHELRKANPDIGYKDDQWMIAQLAKSGFVDVQVRPMPANNLAFVAQRP